MSRVTSVLKRRTPKAKTLALLALLLGASITAFAWMRLHSLPPAEAPDTDEITAADAEIEARELQLAEIVRRESPKAAFRELRQAMAKNAHVETECHTLTHAIGDAAFDKYGSFPEALKYNDDICGSGYAHSLISHVLSETEDPTETIKTICTPSDGFCYHGIGHGLMFHTENDVPASLAFCATLDTDEHRGRCSEGVFMQNFEDHQMYPTPFLYAQDPLRLCREEPMFKHACYHYAGAYLAKGWKTSAHPFRACDDAEPAFKAKCVSGIGSYVMATSLYDLPRAEAACATAPTKAVEDACIDGLVSYHLVNYNSLTKTKEFCASMAEDRRAACLAAVQVRAYNYQ